VTARSETPRRKRTPSERWGKKKKEKETKISFQRSGGAYSADTRALSLFEAGRGGKPRGWNRLSGGFLLPLAAAARPAGGIRGLGRASTARPGSGSCGHAGCAAVFAPLLC